MKRREIELWLEHQHINDYTIHDDLTIDVRGNTVVLNEYDALPVQFGHIKGNFFCRNNNLKTLKGCPHTVDGSFWCTHNLLESLEFCPKTVGLSFYCFNNKLRSLKYCTPDIPGSFQCYLNKLRTLEFLPIVHGGMQADNNPFEVSKETEGIWIRAIKKNEEVYRHIDEKATDRMTAAYEMRWIP